jgi:hypothetical protein
LVALVVVEQVLLSRLLLADRSCMCTHAHWQVSRSMGMVLPVSRH